MESDRAVGEGGVMGSSRELRGKCRDGVRVIGMWVSEVGKQVRSRDSSREGGNRVVATAGTF